MRLFSKLRVTHPENPSRERDAEFQSECFAARNQLDALNRSLAMIEFLPDGTITNANENFLGLMGFRLDEVVGKHHRIFVNSADRDSQAYRDFWTKLDHGTYQSGEFLRVAKGGREVWINATYNPVIDHAGNVNKIVKYAMDVTSAKRAVLALKSQSEALDRSFATIEFNTEGVIIRANDNFLRTIGYSLDEIQGKHHRMFVDIEYSSSIEYQQFWRDLRNGDTRSGEFHRFGKGGKDVFLQASYCPLFDSEGVVSGVIKYAIDVTKSVEARKRSEMVSTAVARNVNEMTQTITEISQRVSSTATLTANEVQHTQQTADTVKLLGSDSRSIEDVLQMIRDLATQTNLLALNATIESARAGEAGRGFQVVATEVKALANETSSATKSIESTVARIQNRVESVIASVSQISDGIQRVSSNMHSISSAVEEQSVSMHSIANTAKELVV